MIATAVGGLAAVMLVTLAHAVAPRTPRGAPPAAGSPPIAAPRRTRFARSRARRSRGEQREVASALPDVVDLLLLATSAGLSLPLAHALVAQRASSPVGAALRRADRDANVGRPRADALIAALAPLGDRAERLAHALADHLRYGAPIVPTLERLGAELRLDRRRQAEQAARRVPVRLLAPLVLCVLPAFALLTVVPLLAATLRELPT